MWGFRLFALSLSLLAGCTASSIQADVPASVSDRRGRSKPPRRRWEAGSPGWTLAPEAGAETAPTRSPEPAATATAPSPNPVAALAAHVATATDPSPVAETEATAAATPTTNLILLRPSA